MHAVSWGGGRDVGIEVSAYSVTLNAAEASWRLTAQVRKVHGQPPETVADGDKHGHDNDLPSPFWQRPVRGLDLAASHGRILIWLGIRPKDAVVWGRADEKGRGFRVGGVVIRRRGLVRRRRVV